MGASEPGVVGFARRHAAAIGGAVVALPLLVAAVRMLVTDGYAPYADLPLIELSVRDVGRHPVELGAYSRFGWFHPGPLMFYALAVPYRLLGSRAVSLPAAAAVLNAGWVFAAAWLGRRRAGLPGLAAVLAGTALVLRAMGASMWTDPWNPSVAVLAFLVFVLACWCLAAGDDVGLVVAVVAGTFALQSHAGYLPFVGLLGVVALGWRIALARARRPALDDASDDASSPRSAARPGSPGAGRTLALRSAVITAAVVGVVLWAPPLLEQATHDPGNLRRIVAYSREAQPVNTMADGARFVAFELGVPPAFVGGELQPGWLGLLDVSAPPLPIGAVLLVAAGVVAAWRREVGALQLVVLAAAGLVAAVVAVSRFADGIFPYLTQWSPVIGMVTWLAIGWTAWVVARPRLPHLARQVVGGLVVATIVVVTGANVVAGATTDPHDLDKSAAVLGVADAAVARLDPAQPVVVELAEPSGGVEALWTADGVITELDRRGFDVRVPETETVWGRRARTDGATQVVAVRRMVDDLPADWQGRSPDARVGDYAVWAGPRPT
ncbi:MAG: hypothetical protein U0Q07_02575 [Acidimicrobiales bacterium]